jgi:uncharacterized protein YpbB
MSSSPVEKAEPYDPGMCLRMTKDQASKLVIGEKVKASVTGVVKGVRECYDDKTKYDVDLKSASVSDVSTTNTADKTYKKLVQK